MSGSLACLLVVLAFVLAPIGISARAIVAEVREAIDGEDRS